MLTGTLKVQQKLNLEQVLKVIHAQADFKDDVNSGFKKKKFNHKKTCIPC